MAAVDYDRRESGTRRDRSLAALAGGFLLLVAAVLGTIWLTVREQQAVGWVRHTLEVENQLSDVMIGLQDAETGERGFLLTGRNEFLGPYEDAADHLAPDVEQLRQLIIDNPRQVAGARRLAATVSTREDLLRAAILSYRRGQPIPAEHFLRGQVLMDEMRSIVADMRGEEDRLLALRTATAARYSSFVIASLAVSTLLVLALGAFAFANGRRRFDEVIASRNALAEANQRLVGEAENRAVAEGQVRQMQKVEAVGQLTGGIAHDFNNMLTLVIGSLDLAMRRLDGPRERVEQYIENALDGARRAAQLTARLLAFSRQQPLAPEPLDVNKLVGGMSELLRRTIGEQLLVETVLAGGLWRAFIDPNQLESAIVNLCVNARDAMPDGGNLTIETSNAYLDDDYASQHVEVEPGQYVLVSVTDTGTGMPPEVIERAFDPFYTTKAPGKGTGLGLSQVYGFVKQSRGHLKIYSEPGTGTTVKIYLPRYTGTQPDAEHGGEVVTGAVSAEMPRARDGEFILVVEDEERVRHVSVDALRELGYTVAQAPDAGHALAVLTQQPRIDLLFTDVVMPEMNGRQLVDKVREVWPQIKILYTTGYTRNAIVHNGMLDAEVELLAKPFTIDQLARKVRKVLDGG